DRDRRRVADIDVVPDRVERNIDRQGPPPKNAPRELRDESLGFVESLARPVEVRISGDESGDPGPRKEPRSQKLLLPELFGSVIREGLARHVLGERQPLAARVGSARRTRAPNQARAPGAAVRRLPTDPPP